MTVRKDRIQLDVEINGKKAGKTYGDLIKDSRTLKKELLGLTPGTDAFIKKSAELKKVNTRLAEIRQQSNGIKSGLSKISFAALLAGAALAIRSFIRMGIEMVKLYDIQAKADAQLKATLKSTSEAAGRSFEDLKKQASDLQKITLFGDEQTQGAQAILLTFTKVREEVFDKSIPLIQDYATVLKTDLNSAALQVGKALNDPVKGIAALGRAGVQFTAEQKNMINSMVAVGDIAGAQKVILGELETQFKGSAEAAAKAGLGGFQQLKNRLSDVKEGFGLLIANGLQRIQPFLEKVVVFLEKLTDSMISGNKATGEYAGAINFIIGYFQYMSEILLFMRDRVVDVIGIFKFLIVEGRKLPIIGNIMNAIGKAFTTFFKLVSNGRAVFAGVRAAAAQALDNMKNRITQTLLALQIFAKKADLFLSIREATKARLRKEIQELENLKSQSEKSGRTLGEAYADAYNKAVAENTNVPSADIDAGVAVAPQPTEDEDTGGGGTTTGGGKTKKTSTTKKKDAKKEDEVTRQALKQYDIGIGALKNYMEARQKEIEKGLTSELNEYEKAYLTGVIAQGEFDAESLEAKRQALDNELNLLTEFGFQETDLFKQKELEKLRIQKEMSDQRIETEKREAEFKSRLQQGSYDAIVGFIDLGLDAAGKEKDEKKKNALEIKAFEAGRVGANLYAEISGYYKAYAGVPGGTLISSVLSGIATLRAGLAIKNILKQKFAEGGRVLDLPQGRITQGSNIRTQPNGDSVLATLKPGEVVLNDQQQSALGGAPTFRAIGVPGFAQGGVVGLPPVDVSPNVPNLNNQNEGVGQLLNKMDQVMNRLLNIKVEATVMHGKIKEKDSELAYIQKLANT